LGSWSLYKRTRTEVADHIEMLLAATVLMCKTSSRSTMPWSRSGAVRLV